MSVRSRKSRRFPAPHTITRFKNTPLAFIDNGLIQVIEHQRAGLPFTVVGVISRKLALSVNELLSELGLSSRSVRARQAKGQNLSAVQAERLVRAARIFKRATEVLEEEGDARNWLGQPHRALGGKSPLSFLDTDAGYHMIEDELTRIEYGIVA